MARRSKLPEPRPVPVTGAIERRYLPNDWPRRLNSTRRLLGLRDRLMRAHRDGLVLPEDEVAVSHWLEWIDGRVGQLARHRLERRRRAERRMARGSLALLLCLGLFIVFLAVGWGTAAVALLLIGCAVSGVVSLVSLPGFLAGRNERTISKLADF